MPSSTKVKLSITLSRDLVERIDAQASGDTALTRSGVIELWLRRATQSNAARALEADTIRYYESLLDEDRTEDEAIARASSRASKRVRYD